MKLYRGDSGCRPRLGRFSYWSDNEDHATKFAGLNLPSEEGLALYVAEVVPEELLDLRASDPWAVLGEATGIDLQARRGLRHDIVHDQLDRLSEAGFDWLVRFADYTTNDGPHRAQGWEDWIYLEDREIPAIRVRDLPDEWK